MTEVSIAFSYNGTVEARSGLLSVPRGYTQNSGATFLNGGNLAAVLYLQGGQLSGTGTIFGKVSTAGTVSPGFSPGEITVNGTYDQRTAGSLTIELGGLSDGSAEGPCEHSINSTSMAPSYLPALSTSA